MPLFLLMDWQILDLRERGSETVSHSEGTGIAAFTTKSMTQQDSPYTPPGHRAKGGRYTRGRGLISTLSSNLVLTTLGSIHPDHMEVDLEQDVVEMDDIRLGLGMNLGTLSTAIGGDDGEPLPEEEGQVKYHQRGSPAPAYNSLEMGFRPGRQRSSTPSLDEHRSIRSIIGGIRIDVEQETIER